MKIFCIEHKFIFYLYMVYVCGVNYSSNSILTPFQIHIYSHITLRDVAINVYLKWITVTKL